jgi:hypothetical protein
MKANNAKVSLQDDERALANSDQVSGCNRQGLAWQLRALGQALEKFNFSAFDLEMRNGEYLVTARATPPERTDVSFSRFVSECLKRLSLWPTVIGTDRHANLRFSPADIEQFDLRGKCQRRDSSKMPDPYSISQLLRGAGCYLDNQKVAKEVGISLEGRWVVVRYQTDEGRLIQAQHDVEYFYDYWVQMYLRRSNRVKLTAPSEPTVFATWKGIQNL